MQVFIVTVHRVMPTSILSYFGKIVHKPLGFNLTLSLGEKFRILVLIADCYTLFVTADLYLVQVFFLLVKAGQTC